MAKAFDGRVALVTGGGRGIGRGIALALAQYGAAVAITARSTTEIEAVAAEVEALGGKALAVSGNVAEINDVKKVINETKTHLGEIDILVNNAGIIGPLNAFELTDPEKWQLTQLINVVGPYYFTHEVLAGMKERNWGRILNITSGAATNNGMPNASAYSVSKAALDMFSRNLGQELAETDVRVNSVAPGVVDTAMVKEVRTTETASTIIRTRFAALEKDGNITDPEWVGMQLVAVMLGAWHGEVLDVRNIPDELQTVLNANPI